jgi:Tannase and feruloyl esterase
MLNQALTVLVSAALALVSPAATAAPVPAVPAGHCRHLEQLDVPGAQLQEASCLDDLTTASTVDSGHTDPRDWAGLHAAETTNPSGVPGIQIDGYFPDTSTFNTHHGWNHDSQFVIRMPDRWNGGLVITGAPGVRTQYANDFIIADWVLAQGYAFASTDKGNSGIKFFEDGRRPGDAIAEWNHRVTQLTLATKAVVRQRYGQGPSRTYMFGISNGGYLTRWQLENRPGLYDGGIDWEGTLFTPRANVLRYLPTALRSYPAYRVTGDAAAHEAMIRAGFAPGSEFLWDFHYGTYWDLTQRIYREELDPTYDGDLQAGVSFCADGTPSCDADYDLATRPRKVKRAIERISLTGRIGKPMLTLHGTLDALLPISTDSDVYDAMIDRAHRGNLHRYYRIADGTHVDGLFSSFPTQLRPMLPCARTAFTALEKWTGSLRTPPPADATITNPRSGDLLNTCSLG